MAWNLVFGDLAEPVRGDPAAYESARRVAVQSGESVADLVTEFARVSTDAAAAGLAGAAAAQLTELVGSIDGRLGELPGVFDALSGVLARHAAALHVLRGDAADAVARAQALRWSADLLATEVGRALDARDRVTYRLQAEAHLVPPDELRLATLRVELDRARGRAASAEQRHVAALAELDGCRRDHATLVEREAALVTATCCELGRLDLGALRDPGRLASIVGAFGHAVAHWTVDAAVDLAHSLSAAAGALAGGNVLDALYHLSDVLDAALRIATVVALALVVVGLTVTPAALVLVPTVLAVGRGLTTAKTALDGGLMALQHPHPETGEPRGFAEVLGGVIALAIPSGAGGMVTGTTRSEARMLVAAGVRGGETAFVRTSAGNAAVLGSVAAGATRVVNPATGRAVSGAALTAMARRAETEVVARGLQSAAAEAIDDAVAGVVEEAVDRVVDRVFPRSSPPGTRPVVGSFADGAAGALPPPVVRVAGPVDRSEWFDGDAGRGDGPARHGVPGGPHRGAGFVAGGGDGEGW